MEGGQKLRFPELAPELKSKRLMDFLKFFGPGAIIASVTIGSGETVWASRSGAIFGYSMFWAFAILCFMKGVQVYTAARYMTLTGEHPVERWAQLPGPKGWFPAITGLITFISFPFYLASLPIMLGTITAWILTGNPSYYPHAFAIAFILGLILLTFLQSYAFLEKVQTGIVGLMLLVMLIATFAAKPNWLLALKGMLIPSFPEFEPWVRDYQDKPGHYPFRELTLWMEIVAYMGVIGGGVQDYVGYVGMLREKGWGLIGRIVHWSGNRDDDSRPVPLAEDPQNVRLGRAWLKAPLIDCIISFSSVVIFTATFLLLGAVLLHPRHDIPSGMELYNKQVIFLTRLHPAEWAKAALAALYKLGVFFAIFGTVYGAYELYVRTAHECVCSLSPRWKDLPLQKMRLWTLTYTGLGGIALVLYAWWTAVQDPKGVGWDPLNIMRIPLHITGVFLSGPWCFAMIWTDRKFLPKPFQMSRLLVFLNVVCGIAFTAFGARALYDDIMGLLK